MTQVTQKAFFPIHSNPLVGRLRFVQTAVRRSLEEEADCEKLKMDVNNAGFKSFQDKRVYRMLCEG